MKVGTVERSQPAVRAAGWNVLAAPVDYVPVRADFPDVTGASPAVPVVDDHQAVAEIVAVALRAEGFDRVHPVPAAACDVQGAVAAADDLRPDIALVDLYLAGGADRGLAVIRALAYRGFTVLAFTASDDARDTARSLEAGAAAVLHKSEPFDVVVEAIEKVAGARLVDVRFDVGPMSTADADGRARHDPLQVFESLTPAEATVLRGLVAGASPHQIAANHSVTIRTTRSHIESIHRKLGVRSQLAAVALAHELGWPAN